MNKSVKALYYYGEHMTPFGLCTLGVYDDHICYLGFGHKSLEEIQTYSLNSPKTDLQYRPDMVKTLITQVLSQSYIPLPLLFRGTAFQMKVWQALLKIPRGNLVSYQDIATMIDQPKAARAVGNAVAANTIAYLIPCHRVIKRCGDIGNYRWGRARKAAIIAWEKNNSNKR